MTRPLPDEVMERLVQAWPVKGSPESVGFAEWKALVGASEAAAVTRTVPVRSGQTINVNYVGVTYADGKEFDSSWSRAEPFSFEVGAGNVIKGWDQGLLGVKVGSRVQLDIPASLAYGVHPTGGQPAGTLRFIVDVLSAS